MPILITNPKWSQTVDQLQLRVPLKVASRNAASVNIFTHEDFIKINYAPYYFEAFLAHPIVANQSHCKIYENEVRFTFQKSPLAAQMWSTFERAAPIERTAIVAAKENVIQRAQADAQAEDRKRAEHKTQIRRDEISREVERLSNTRQAIEERERFEFQSEMAAVEEKIRRAEAARKPAAAIKAPTASIVSPPPMPSVRQRGTIDVRFSDRKFPTPMRESQNLAEQEWLHQQHLARKTIGLCVLDY